ncbi:MAG: septal ring lytic transglycosylase RlpA family protein [Filomicrobium sp.]
MEFAHPQEKRLNRRSTSWAAGLLLLALAAPDQAEAKTPGRKHCYKSICHRVKSLSETRALVGKTLQLKASHYGHCRQDRYNPCRLTSSGEKFRADSPDNAASPDLPDGTILLVYYAATGRAAVVRVNNAGPYWRGRDLDVSQATAQALGFDDKGVAELHVRVLRAPVETETRYRSGRKYRRVPGYIGKYASLDHADRALRFMASYIARARLAEVRYEDFDEFAIEAIPVRNLKRGLGIANFARLISAASILKAARPSFVWLTETTPSVFAKLQSSTRGVRPQQTTRLVQLPHLASAAAPASHSAGAVKQAAARQLQRRIRADVLAPLGLASLNHEMLPRGVMAESRVEPSQLTPLATDRTVVAWSYDDTLSGRFTKFAEAAGAAARKIVARSRVIKPPPRNQDSAWWNEASWRLSFESVSKVLADAANTATRKARDSVTRFRSPFPKPLPNDVAVGGNPQLNQGNQALQVSRN